MRRTTMLCVLFMLAPVAARGEAASGAPDPVTAELAKLNGTLREIAGLLKKQAHVQELDLLMKRLQLSEGRLADSEKALKGLEGEQRSLENERGQVEMHLSMIDSARERPGIDETVVEAEKAQSEGQLKRIRQRIAELTSEIGTLESDVAARREELRSWMSALDRRLAGQ